MITAQKIIYSIINKSYISNNDITCLKEADFDEYELLSIFYHIKFGQKEYNLIKTIIETKIKPEKLNINYYLNHPKKEYSFIINSLINDSTISKEHFTFLFDEIQAKRIELSYLALILIHIYYFGLNKNSLLSLTKSMVESGKVYDYRNAHYLGNYLLTRRYPTGALSEKIALLLPALLSYYHKQLNIYSPFLIAKSLGFTGGTWDKLSVFENIKFIHPEERDLFAKILMNCGIAYCMTEGNVAPFDKFLYQFRSMTGTISSKPLIISSIASKQLAIPVDFLLIDFRYGEGSFIDSIEEAYNIGEDLKLLIENEGVSCEVIYTNTFKLNGVCIGNVWELYEAICLLKGEYENDYLKLETSISQINLLVEFFIKIYNWIVPNTSEKDFKEEVLTKLKNGIYNLKNKDYIMQHDILSSKEGVLESINQKELGVLINYELDNNNYDFFKSANKTTNLQGAIIKKTIGEKVEKGDILCTIYCDKNIRTKDVEVLFKIKTTANKQIGKRAD